MTILLTDREMDVAFSNALTSGAKENGYHIAKAQAKKLWEELEKHVFYVDNRGFIALKPNATKNWLDFKKEIEE